MKILIKKIAEVSGITALTAVKNTIPTVNDIYVKIKRKKYIYIYYLKFL